MTSQDTKINELSYILRLLFKQDNNDMSYISVVGNIMSISIYKDWINEMGGWECAQWDLNFDFLEEQSDDTQRIITEFLLQTT